MRISIIGTAGRGADALRMTAELFEQMVRVARHLIQTNGGDEPVDLISGGAAWSDSVALYLWLRHRQEFRSLTLHLPCRWDHDKRQHHDNGSWDWKENPGRTANRYHQEFSAKMNRNTLADMHDALSAGATFVDTYKGFHERNGHVADCDYLIAFTWGDGATPTDGGTADTWKKSKAKCKTHVRCSSLLANM